MPRYRKKPVEVEAEQFFRHGDKIPNGAEYISLHEFTGRPDCVGIMVFAVKTLNGWVRINNGDWIITGVNGEKYPCDPAVFKATYEEVK